MEKASAAPSKKVMGAGEFHGGTYNELKVFGSSSAHGDVACNTLRVQGSCDFDGDVRVGRASIAGSTDIGGDVRADKLKAWGSLSVRGDVNGGNVRIDGSSLVRGGIHVERLYVRGAFQARGDVEATEVRLAGGFSIEGLLSGDDVVLRPYRRCTVRHIGGGRLTVERPRRWMRLFPFGSAGGGLRAKEIEVDDVHLVNTMAEEVRCRSGYIGPGCRIRTLYTGGDVEIDRRAAVEKHVKG